MEKGSLNQAAELLYVSQPALSQYINRLESKLGARILIREANPIRMTEAGEVYYGNLKKILQIERQTQRTIDELEDRKCGHVVVGAQLYQSAFLLTDALRSFTKDFPGLEIKLIEEKTLALEHLAAEGVSDFSISILPLLNQNLVLEPLFDEEVYICCASDDPLAIKYKISTPQEPPFPKIDLMELKDKKFIVQNKDLKLRRSFDEICDIFGHVPEIVSETNDIMMAEILASTGIGITLIPSLLAKSLVKEERVIFFQSKQQIRKRHVAAVYNDLYPMSKASRTFLEFLKQFILRKQHNK